MTRKTIGVVVVLLILTSVGGGVAPVVTASETCSYPVTATDATGTEVTLDAPPTRIVSLNPSVAQTLWEIGAAEKVVGVSQFADFLPGASNLTTVTSGYPATVQVETVIDLDPDLVLAPNTIDNESVSRLRKANITIFRFPAAFSVEDVYTKTERIGMLVGACDGAKETVTWMKSEIDLVEAAVEEQDRPPVLYPMGDGFAPGPNTFIGAMINASGGDNIVANANTTRPYPQLSGEFVVAQDPQWLILAASPDQMDAQPREIAPNSPALRNTTAWEKGNFVVVNRNNISQPAPRIVYPVRKMVQSFHPDAYATANDSSTVRNSTLTSTSPTSSPSVPGFGIGQFAFVAFAIAALGRRR